MVFLHGVYRFDPKIVAFRNDFCLSCGVPRRAYQVKSLTVLHLLFIPVLPLGNWRRWRCAVCGRNPHAQPNLGKVWQWAIVVLLAFVVFGSWVVPAGGEPSIWFGRLVVPLLLFGMLRYTLKSKPDVRLKDKLLQVHPGDESGCPLCGQALVLQEGWRCSGCGIKRIPLKPT